jgi:hypothetical protein
MKEVVHCLTLLPPNNLYRRKHLLMFISRKKISLCILFYWYFIPLFAGLRLSRKVFAKPCREKRRNFMQTVTPFVEVFVFAHSEQRRWSDGGYLALAESGQKGKLLPNQILQCNILHMFDAGYSCTNPPVEWAKTMGRWQMCGAGGKRAKGETFDNTNPQKNNLNWVIHILSHCQLNLYFIWLFETQPKVDGYEFLRYEISRIFTTKITFGFRKISAKFRRQLSRK